MFFVFFFLSHLRRPMASRNTPPFPTIILCHVTPHKPLFHLANHSVSCLSVRLSVSIPTAPLSSLSYQSSFVVDVSPPPTAVFSPQLLHPSPLFPCTLSSSSTRASLLPTRTFSPTCFISPFFTAVHEMGCMYDESVELEMGKK